MSVKNFTYTVTMQQQEDLLTKVFTYLKAQEPEVQLEIESDPTFKLNMGLSVAGAGIAAMLIATERLGGHNAEYNLEQLIRIVHYYLKHGGPCFSPDQQDLFG